VRGGGNGEWRHERLYLTISLLPKNAVALPPQEKEGGGGAHGGREKRKKREKMAGEVSSAEGIPMEKRGMPKWRGGRE